MVREAQKAGMWFSFPFLTIVDAVVKTNILTYKGLQFDPEKLVELGCTPSLNDDDYLNQSPQNAGGQDDGGNGTVPGIQIDAASPSPGAGEEEEKNMDATDWSHFSQSNVDGHGQEKKDHHHHHLHPFHEMMHRAHVSRIHDSLEFNDGLTHMQVLSWKIVSPKAHP